MESTKTRAVARSYYHQKVSDSQPMETGAKAMGQVHDESVIRQVTTNRYHMHDQTGMQAQEEFHGYGRMAQALRWVSSAALANDTNKGGKKFSEVQAGFVGKSLILGSNANQHPDDEANPIASALKGALGGTEPEYKSGPRDEEEARGREQKQRHINQLRQFVGNDEFFNAFVDSAVNEAQTNRKNAVRRQLSGLRQSLFNLATDGDTGGFKVFDAGPRGNSKGDPSYHAEQRVLDYAIEHHDDLLNEVSQVKSIAKDNIRKMRLTVAGTKAPCHRCRTTEDNRGAQSLDDKSRLKAYRFETDSGAMFGAAKKGATFSRHPGVEQRTTSALSADIQGTNKSKFDEPILPLGSDSKHDGDLFSYAMARRDSVSEIHGKFSVGRKAK